MIFFSKYVQRSHLLFVVTALLLLSHCHQISQKPILKADGINIELIKDVIKSNYNNLYTLNGIGQIVVESSRQSFSATAHVLLSKPDSLLIRVEALLGLDVGTFFIDRFSYLIFSPLENLAYIGASSDTLPLEPFLGFDFTFDQVLRSVSGLALVEDLQSSRLEYMDEEFVITGKSTNNSYKIWTDLMYGTISRVEVRNQNNKILRIEEYKRFKKINGVRLPQMIRFIRPVEKQSLTIFYEQLYVNNDIPSKEFYVKIPKDVLKLRL